MTEIGENEYFQVLREIILKKKKSIDGKNLFETNNKVARYAMGKGYESELIWKILNEE